jgi:hypothetical protein
MMSNNAKPLTFEFIGAGSEIALQLTNRTEQTLKSVEILTVFLKDEASQGAGPSQAHIKFEVVKSIQPKERALIPHRTWINGKPVGTDADQLQRLTIQEGQINPYVLDISWSDSEGKARFQRIPVGH